MYISNNILISLFLLEYTYKLYKVNSYKFLEKIVNCQLL